MIRNRNSLFFTTLQALLLILACTLQSVQATEKQKVVYHVSEIEKIGLALSNAGFHIQGVGGPENIDLVMVVNGAAIKGFTKANFDPKMQKKFDDLNAKGVHF